MGCVPKNRVQKIPEINVIPTKIQSFKNNQSRKSKNGSQQNINSNFLLPKFPSYESQKNKKTLQAQQPIKTTQNYTQNRLSNTRNSLHHLNQRYQNTNINPKDNNKFMIKRQSQQTKQLSKLQSIDNLSILSKIDTKSKSNFKNSFQKKPNKDISKAEQVNITFGNNLFGVLSSKNNSRVYKSPNQKQKQLILLNQLRNMNQQNVKKINIQNRNFNA